MNPLHDTIEKLRARHGWTEAELSRRSGVAGTTLGRIESGRGGRADALAKLDESFGLEPGTLDAVKRGDATLQDVLAQLETPTPQLTDPSLAFRVESLERAVAEIRQIVGEIQTELTQPTGGEEHP